MNWQLVVNVQQVTNAHAQYQQNTRHSDNVANEGH